MWLLFIFLVLCVASALLHWSQRQRRAAVAKIPGPYSLPLVGSLLVYFGVSPKNLINVAWQMIAKYGRIQRYWFFNRLYIHWSDVELSEQLLSSPIHIVKHPFYNLLSLWLGNGLLLSKGKTWYQRRKIIMPTFHFKILEQFVEVFDQQSSTCLQRLASCADGCTPFDIYPYICLAALDIIAETAMGTKVQAQTGASTPYAKAVKEWMALMSWRFVSFYLHNELLFTLTHPLTKWRQTQLIRTLHSFTIGVIEQRRQQLEEAKPSKQLEQDDVGSKQRLALLDLLLQAHVEGQPLSNREIREEVDTFMVAGHDTTTSATCFALVQIARHPQVQAKLLAELLQVLGADPQQPVTMRALGELKYLECIIKESLRLYPAVPLVGRQLETDFHYTHSRLGKGVLPAGTELAVNLLAIMNDPELVPDAGAFRPERHEQSSAVGLQPACPLLAFSAGPRNCVGQKFAQLELKMLLAKIVRQYELLPLGEPLQPVFNIVLRSSTGFQLGLRTRNLQQL